MVESSLFDDYEPAHPLASHAPYSQSILSNDFKFQQTMAVHQGAVRSMSTLDSGYLLSGSMDTSSKLFILNNATGRYDFEKEINYHTGYVLSTASS